MTRALATALCVSAALAAAPRTAHADVINEAEAACGATRGVPCVGGGVAGFCGRGEACRMSYGGRGGSTLPGLEDAGPRLVCREAVVCQDPITFVVDGEGGVTCLVTSALSLLAGIVLIAFVRREKPTSEDHAPDA